MSDCELIEMSQRDLAVVRARVPMSELKAVFDRAYVAVLAAIQAQGLTCTGAPVGYYPSMPGEIVEIEAGFPTDRAIAPSGEVVASRLPGGRIATTLHEGPYEGLEKTYGKLFAWLQGRSLEPGGAVWEEYLTDPSAEPDTAKWRTRIYATIA